VLDTKSREIFISKDVIFHERIVIQLEDQIKGINSEEDLSYLSYEDDGEHKQQEENTHTQTEEDTSENHDVRRSSRLRKAPDYLKDYYHQIHSSIIRHYNTQVMYPIKESLFN